MKKVFKWIGIIVLVLAVIVGTLFMVYVRPFMKEFMATKTVKFDPELTLILGGGGNTGILASDSMVLVIDTKMQDASEKLYDTVMAIAKGKPILIVNTHVHKDHAGGNDKYKGHRIMAGGNYTKEQWKEEAGEETMPTDWIKDSLTFNVGNERVTILNLQRNTHTVSDIVVYLHNRKMLFGGDVILNKQAPALIKKNNPDPEGYLAAFDMLENKFDIKTVVPGHGNIGGKEVIDNFRQYFKDMATAANDPSQEGAMKEKYKDWRQIPFMMSPGATISYMKDNKKQ